MSVMEPGSNILMWESQSLCYWWPPVRAAQRNAFPKRVYWHCRVIEFVCCV